MAADLFRADPAFQALVQRAGARVDADLERICLRGPARELTRTKFLQPLLVCVSLGYLRQLTDRGLEPDLVAGHSLGEITALAAAGVVTFEQAVDMAAQRGEFMELAAAQSPGGMLAVITPHRAQILDWLASSGLNGRLALANDNTPEQIVFSGEFSALDEYEHFIKTSKLGECRRLPVSGPWHSAYMLGAQREFANWLHPITFQAPRTVLYMNISAASETEPERIRDLAIRNLTEPVLWRTCMERLREDSPRRLYEIGPGRVLSGLARANGFGQDTRIFNVNNLRGVETAAVPA